MEHRWPNPDAVVFPTTQPPGFPCSMTTREAGKTYPLHYHSAFLNPAGDGNTDVDSGHYHRVRDFRVLPDESDGHTHQLTTLPCGVGQPQSVGREGQTIAPYVDERGMRYMQMADAGALAPTSNLKWWLLGGAVVAGLVIGGVVLYHHMQEDEGE